MSIIQTINDGIKEAMRSRDTIRLNTLRMLKAKILAEDARCMLPDSEVIKLCKTYLGNLQEALDHAQTVNRPELVQQLQVEISVVQEFLPKAPSREETKTLLLEAISESGAKTKKDFGKVMKCIMQKNNALDGRLVKELAEQLLTD